MCVCVCLHTNPYKYDIPITIRFNLTVCMILTALLSLPQPLCNFQWSQVSETRSIWLRKAHSFYTCIYEYIYDIPTTVYICSRVYDETEWICGLRLSVHCAAAEALVNVSTTAARAVATLLKLQHFRP